MPYSLRTRASRRNADKVDSARPESLQATKRPISQVIPDSEDEEDSSVDARQRTEPLTVETAVGSSGSPAPEPLSSAEVPAPEPVRRSRRTRLQAQPTENDAAYEPRRRSKRQRVQAPADDSDSEYDDTVEVEDTVEGQPQHWIDENGLIRVGTQPQPDVQFIRWASEPAVRATFKARLKNMRTADRNAILDRDLAARIWNDHQFAASKAGNPQQYRELVCGYTGQSLTISPGHPLTYSLEGLYSVCMLDDEFNYHVPANLTVIGRSLNFVKTAHAPLVLPLVAQYIKSHQEMDTGKRIAKQHWIVTGMTNLHHLTQAFGLLRDKESRAANFNSKWKHVAEDYLETIRTGVRTTKVIAILDARHENKPLPQGHDEFNSHDWSTMYETLVKIAAKYKIPQADFDEFFTVEGPDSSPVLFPYHPLARRMVSWDWHSLFRRALTMLQTLRKSCNIAAEKAGLGEATMTPVLVIYWWAHHLCEKLQNIRQENPNATRQWLHFEIFHDRFGLPIIPKERSHVFGSSLCKKQDHGIAMLFGVTDAFDPVTGFDLQRSTVTIDTWATNAAMYNFPSSVWEDIKDNMASVPFYHPYWRPHESLGMDLWYNDCAQDNTLQVIPRQPVPEFDIPLVPIGRWMSGDTVEEVQCPTCIPLQTFASPGLLIRHMRQDHNDFDNQIGPDEPVLESLYRCTWDGCEAEFNDDTSLRYHIATHNGKFTCQLCHMPFGRQSHLDRHAEQHADGRVFNIPCPVDDCPILFDTEGAVGRHMLMKHPMDDNARCGRCRITFATQGELKEHKKTHTKKEAIFPCEVEGCPHPGFTSKSALTKHMIKEHPDVERRIPCDHPGCEETFPNARALYIHKGDRHSACDCPVCKAAFKRKGSLRKHMENMHGLKLDGTPVSGKKGVNEEGENEEGDEET